MAHLRHRAHFERVELDLHAWRDAEARSVELDVEWSLRSGFYEVAVEPSAQGWVYRFCRVCDEYAAQFGDTAQGIAGRRLEEVMPAPAAEHIRRMLDAVVEAGRAMRFVQDVVWNGRRVTVESMSVPLRSIDGRLTVVTTGGDITAEIPAARAAARARAMLETVFAVSSDMLALVDQAGRFRHVNAAFARVLGYDPVSLVGRSLADLLDAPSTTVLDDLASVESGDVLPARMRTASGHWRHVDVSVSSTTESGPPSEPPSFVLVARDMTAARKASQALARRAEQQAAVAAFGRFALESRDLAATIERAVTVVAEALDADASSLMRVLEPSRLRLLHSRGLEAAASGRVPDLPAELAAALTSTQPVIVSDWRDDERFAAHLPLVSALGIRSSLSVAVLAGEDPWGLLGVHCGEPRQFSATDADFVQAVAHLLAAALERDRIESEIRQQAFHDGLTGLPNRLLLADRLGHAASRRHEGLVAVYFIDIDGFKAINDRYGHAAGDRVIAEVGRRLVGCVRGGDTVARYGGDEFVVVCEDVHDQQEALAAAQRMVASVAMPVDVGGRSLNVSVSVGVAGRTGGDTTVEELLAEADQAMYQAKDAGLDVVGFGQRLRAPRGPG